MKRSAPRPSRIAACSAKSSRRTRGAAGSPSGPIEPPMKTSRPVTSRASRASLTPAEMIASRSSSRKWCASFRRLAPNVFVSISSAPALMKLTWSDTTASGARRFASSGVRRRGTAADRRAPIPPSPTIAGPLCKRSRKRLRGCVDADTSSPSDTLDTSIRTVARPGLAPCPKAGCRGFTGPVPSASLDAERDAARFQARVYKEEEDDPPAESAPPRGDHSLGRLVCRAALRPGVLLLAGRIAMGRTAHLSFWPGLPKGPGDALLVVNHAAFHPAGDRDDLTGDVTRQAIRREHDDLGRDVLGLRDFP